MNNYWMLECLSPSIGFNASVVSYRDNRYWNAGERFVDPPNQLVEVKLEMKFKSVIPEFEDIMPSFMSKRLYAILIQAGVTNLDIYPLKLIDSRTNDLLSIDHVAFNLIGVESIAHRHKPRSGLLMFRRVDALNGIVVHRSVKEAIEAAGITTLTFLNLVNGQVRWWNRSSLLNYLNERIKYLYIEK